MALIPIGVVAETSTPQKPLEQVLHWEKYGGKDGCGSWKVAETFGDHPRRKRGAGPEVASEIETRGTPNTRLRPTGLRRRPAKWETAPAGGEAAEYRVIVVGAGPAGLMAAGQAATAGAPVLLLEKMDRPGHKLGLTGNGRGNLSNTAPLEDLLAQFGPQGHFLRPALARFGCAGLRAFLLELGLPTVVEPDGRVYPASGRAQDVVDALWRWTAACGVVLQARAPVERLLVEGGRVEGVALASGEVHHARAVVLATGGASYPATGSSGDGYRLAAALGHTIVPIRPALVPLETAGDIAPRLQGLALQGETAHLWLDGRKRASASGDLLFTHFGLSGPLVLSLSRQVVDAVRQGRQVALSLDLRPDLDEGALDPLLRRALEGHGRQLVRTVLHGWLPRRLAALALEQAGIPADRRAHELAAAERRRLLRWLKDFRLEITGCRPWSEAQVTAGGVDTAEVDPRTMASRLVAGLYFAGEVLDVDAGSGGYNLQAAFSTGWAAGQAAARG